MKNLSIRGREVGPGKPVYVVAEMSGNHHQQFDYAEKIVLAAKAAGADAIKLQTYTADTLTISCDKTYFRIGEGTLWDGRQLHDLYREAYTPWEWQPRLAEIARSVGLELFSTPFDDTAVDFLESMGVAAYKIASFEIVELDLIRRVARTGKPLILSTGMASFTEIEEALAAARGCGAEEIALLKCTSAYPAPPEESNLRTIRHAAEAFDVPIGLSDHTLGIAVPIASIGLGACIIEKHLTLSRDDAGPDSGFSLEPEEFRQMVAGIRTAEKSLGRVFYGVSSHEVPSRVFRRSLFAVRDIKRGERLTRENVRAIRPGYGLAPKHLTSILGREAACDIERGTPIEWPHVSRLQSTTGESA